MSAALRAHRIHVIGMPVGVLVFRAFRKTPQTHSLYVVYQQLLHDQLRQHAGCTTAQMATLLGLTDTSIERALWMLERLGLIRIARGTEASHIGLVDELTAPAAQLLCEIAGGCAVIDVKGGRVVDRNGIEIPIAEGGGAILPNGNPGPSAADSAVHRAECGGHDVRQSTGSDAVQDGSDAARRTDGSSRRRHVRAEGGGRSGSDAGARSDAPVAAPTQPERPIRKFPAPTPAPDEHRAAVEQVIAHANQKFGTKYTADARPRYKAIRRALTEWGYSVGDLKVGIDSAAVDPWWRTRKITDPLLMFGKLASATSLISKGGRATGPYDKRALDCAQLPLDQVEVEVW